jgi:hypothetical protein
MFIGQSLPLIAGLIGGGIAAWQGPTHASQEFYSVAAQTIPVLLLALALEARLLGVRGVWSVRPDEAVEKGLGPIRDQIEDLTVQGAKIAASDEDRRKMARQIGRTHKVFALTEREARDFARRLERSWRAWLLTRGSIAFLICAALVVVELRVLKVLADESYATANARLIFGAIGLGLTALAFAALLGRQRQPATRPQQRRKAG